MKHQFQSGKKASALILLLVTVTIIELSLLTSFKLVSMTVKRSDEAELKFRLAAYKTAIEKYQRYFRRYPSSLKELETLPPNPRMIRRLYKDPMNREGKWKIVHQDDGILIRNVVSSSMETSTDGSKYNSWTYDENLIFSSIMQSPTRNNN